MGEEGGSERWTDSGAKESRTAEGVRADGADVDGYSVPLRDLSAGRFWHRLYMYVGAYICTYVYMYIDLPYSGLTRLWIDWDRLRRLANLGEPLRGCLHSGTKRDEYPWALESPS